MDNFGYPQRYKVAKVLAPFTPIILLLGLLAAWVFLVLPSRGDVVEVQFNWWVPLLGLALMVWAGFRIRAARRVLSFKVRLSEDAIEVAEERIPWSKISKIDFRGAPGNSTAAMLHIDDGRIVTIPGTIEGYAYIRGVLEGRGR